MNTEYRVASHDSQDARFEQAMTAIAEAQIKTKEAQARTGRELAKLTRAMTALAKSHAETETATRSLTRQWEAYLNTLRKN